MNRPSEQVKYLHPFCQLPEIIVIQRMCVIRTNKHNLYTHFGSYTAPSSLIVCISDRHVHLQADWAVCEGQFTTRSDLLFNIEMTGNWISVCDIMDLISRWAKEVFFLILYASVHIIFHVAHTQLLNSSKVDPESESEFI